MHLFQRREEVLGGTCSERGSIPALELLPDDLLNAKADDYLIGGEEN